MKNFFIFIYYQNVNYIQICGFDFLCDQHQAHMIYVMHLNMMAA